MDNLKFIHFLISPNRLDSFLQMKLLNKIAKCSIMVKKVDFCPNSTLV